MKPKEVVSSLINELSGRLATPVGTSGVEESRPVPAVLVDGLDITNHNHHNSNFAGEEWQNGEITAEIYRHYYSARVDLVVRQSDEIGAYDILGNLQVALGVLAENPRQFIHEDINDMSLLGSGQISYQFHEPTETEINQSLVIETFYDSTHANFDSITAIEDNLNFN